MNRGDVVEDPKSSALCCHDQILAVYFDVGNWDVWQIQLKGLPVATVVERDKHAKLGAGIKQSFAIWIFAHNARGPVGRNTILAIRQTRPGFSIIVSAIDIRFVIAEQPAIDGKVCGPLSMR